MLVFFILAALFCSSLAQSGWNQVAIGGGGYVIGLVRDPTTDLTYIRTDVGGAYVSNGPDAWTPITDNMKSANLFGGESIQLDPNNPQVVYFAAGMYDYYPGCVYKSTNQGQNWTCTLNGIKGGSNQNNRFAGERIFVDLANSSRVLYGSRYAGLYQSLNAAESWKSIASNIPLDQYAKTGITAVFADPSSIQTNPYKLTQTIYLINYNDSIYKSSDGGDTWASIGGPKLALRGAVSVDGKYVYVSGGMNDTSGVSRYTVSSNSWSDVTPNTTLVQKGFIYNAVTVHPTMPNIVIAATRWPNAAINPVYRSNDNGQTWSEISTNFTLNCTVPWWSKYSYQMAISSVTIDPRTPSTAWITDFAGTWVTQNFEDEHPIWTTIEHGHEELVVMCLSAPPTGNLQSGTADANGFDHINLNEFPLVNRGSGDTTSLDYVALKPSFIVSAQTIRYESTGGGYYSMDGGATWKGFASQQGLGGKITVSANGNTIIWAPINRPLQVSSDGGATWTISKGAVVNVTLFVAAGPTDIWHYWEPLYADRVNSSVIYCAKYGIFYRSNDGGYTSSVVYSHGYDVWGVRASSIAGDVWYWSQPAGVLQHSSDYGNTWVNISAVTSIYQIAFGKNRQGSGVSTLYIVGAVNKGAYGVYRSEDAGQTWIQYDSLDLPVPLINTIAADGNTFGRVYIGTSGRGIFYADQQTDFEGKFQQSIHIV